MAPTRQLLQPANEATFPVEPREEALPAYSSFSSMSDFPSLEMLGVRNGQARMDRCRLESLGAGDLPYGDQRGRIEAGRGAGGTSGGTAGGAPSGSCGGTSGTSPRPCRPSGPTEAAASKTQGQWRGRREVQRRAPAEVPVAQHRRAPWQPAFGRPGC